MNPLRRAARGRRGGGDILDVRVEDMSEEDGDENLVVVPVELIWQTIVLLFFWTNAMRTENGFCIGVKSVVEPGDSVTGSIRVNTEGILPYSIPPPVVYSSFPEGKSPAIYTFSRSYYSLLSYRLVLGTLLYPYNKLPPAHPTRVRELTL